MSEAVLILTDLGSEPARAIKAVRDALGLSISDIKAAVGSGQPVVRRSLFGREAPMFARVLSDLLSTLGDLGASAESYEVLPSQSFEFGKRNDFFLLNTERLDNMIQSREQDLRW
jgi:hypothetical protein